jgi:MtrB/PioB family decaheme-associated outer membrane protein
MKRSLIASLVLALAVPGPALLAAAQDPPKEDQLLITGRAVLGDEGVDARKQSSKFTEYRDIPNGFLFSFFDLSLTKGQRYLTFSADRIRQRDSRYTVSAGDYGRFRGEFVWDKIPHRFSFLAKTLYVENEPGLFTLSDEIRTLVQAAVGNGGFNAAANIGAGRSLLSSFLDGVHGIDLGLQRNKGVLDLTYTPSVPWSLNLYASRERRTGNREAGASFGFNFANEIPSPVDFTTTDLDARAEYARDWGTLQAGYAVSLFDNEIESMIWDSPLRITDQTYDTPFGAYVDGNGSARGQMALAPSTTAHRLYFKGLVKLARYTRLYGTFSYGLFSQNAALVPFTINSALAADYAGALSPPRPTARAKAGVLSFDLTFSSRIVRSLDAKAGFRYYNFDDRTESQDLSGTAFIGQTWDPTPVSIEPYSFMRWKAFADLTWRFTKSASLNAGYSFNRIERTEGQEIEGAAENTSDENSFYVSLDANPVDWLMLRARYLHGIRRWALDATDVIYIPGFAFKRYYEADRNRDSVTGLVGLSFVRNLDLELSYTLGLDKYPTAEYGLTKSDFTSYGADLSYAFAKMATVFAFYEHELYRGDQRSRASAGDVFSTDPADDWSARLEDHVDTVGAGASKRLVKDRLDLNVTYSFSRVRGTSLLATPEDSPTPAANFTDGLDSTRIQILRAQATWRLVGNLSVAGCGWFERWDLSDIVRNDDTVDLVTAGSGMYLGALQPGYLYWVGSVKFIYTW